MESIFECKSILLDEAPVKLKEAVDGCLSDFADAKLLKIEHIKRTPYIDKSIIEDTYSAYLMYGNLFTVMKISVCSNQEWSDREVRKSSMIAGDIIKFVQLGGAWFAEYNGWKSE